MPQQDAIVIGSGPNGLAAAIELARVGWKVTVYEAAESVGGGMRTAELTLPGFRHDICSAIHPLGISSPFFGSLRLEEEGLEWVHPDLPLAHPFDDGTAAVLSRSFPETAESLGRDGPAWERLFRPLAEEWDRLLPDLLAPPRLPRHPLLLARFGRGAVRSARGLAESRFRDFRARALFAGLAAHIMMPLEDLPTAAFGLVLGASAHAMGWPLPKGGSGRLAGSLAAVLHRHGGRIVTGREVRRLEELPPAGAVLFDLTPRQIVALAGDRLPTHTLHALRRYRYGTGVFKIDWALREPVPWKAEACRRAGTVHLGGTLEEIAAGEAAIWRGETVSRPYVLVAQQSLFDPSRAPEGRHTLWAYCHVPPGSGLAMTEAIVALIERFAPGFRETVLARHTMSARQMETYNANYVGGDINGGLQDVRQMLARPTLSLDPYRLSADGLFICSSSTPPGGGVHGMCGYHAARSVLRAFR